MNSAYMRSFPLARKGRAASGSPACTEKSAVDAHVSMRGNGGISGAADRLEFWDTLVDRRKRGKWAVRLGLVPISHGIIVVGAVVGVTMLDRGA